MKILLAGEGGQGIQIAAEILTYAAFLEGKPASLIPNFGVEQRGGVSLAFIIIGEDASYPKFEKANAVVVFCDRAVERVKRYLGTETKLYYGPGMSNERTGGQVIGDKGLPAKVWNMIVLGQIVQDSQVVKKESLQNALEEKFKDKFAKDNNLKEINFQAIS